MLVIKRIVFVALTSFSVGLAHAIPVIDVDVDPFSPGTQSAASVTSGDIFSVDVLISSVEATDPLNGFQLTLVFDAAVLNATDVTDGGFLPSPVVTLSNIDNSAGIVEFAEASLGAFSASGDGVLARVDFQTTAVGVSALDLSDVLLSGPFGVAVDVAAINGATVSVTSPSGTVPVPSLSALLALGLLGLFIADRSTTGHRHRRLAFKE